jgi:hypothetical protein
VGYIKLLPACLGEIPYRISSSMEKELMGNRMRMLYLIMEIKNIVLKEKKIRKVLGIRYPSL